MVEVLGLEKSQNILDVRIQIHILAGGVAAIFQAGEARPKYPLTSGHQPLTNVAPLPPRLPTHLGVARR